MIKTAVKIGPNDNGRRMTLAKFEHAQGQEGYLYELSRGVVTVMNVPGIKHMLMVCAIRDQLVAHKLSHTESVYAIAAGNECKILLEKLQSERHPDLSIYMKPPPKRVEDFWSVWIPELVIEVVSRGSSKRDYEQKPEEYFDFGVREYWIVDGKKARITVLRRARGKWAEQVLKAGVDVETDLLPGFKLKSQAVFDAVERS